MRGAFCYAIISVLLLLAGSAFADTFYVSVNGSDANPGTYSQPFQSISKAFKSLSSNDTPNCIYLFAGEYSGEANVGLTVPFSVNLSIEESQEIGSAVIVMDGSESNMFMAPLKYTHNISFSLHGLSLLASNQSQTTRGAYSTGNYFFDSISMTYCLATNLTYAVYVADATTTVQVHNSTFSRSSVFLYSATSDSLTITFSKFIYPSMGITAMSVHGMTVDHCIFQYSTEQGGALAVYNSQSLLISNSIFRNNSAESVTLSDITTVLIEYCEFSFVTSSSGNLLINEVENVTLSTSNFSYNQANSGAGLTLSNSNATLTDCLFYHNTAVYEGGGAFCYKSNVIFDSCLFEENTAFYAAACAKDPSTSVTSIDNEFEGNTQLFSANSCFTYSNE